MEKNNALIFKRGLEILKKTSGKIVLTAASFALITSLAACGQATDQKTAEPEEPTTSQTPSENTDTRTEEEKEADTKVGQAMEIMGEELGGVKFDDLSESGKETVLNFFNSVDSKVDEWIPNYKERFEDWTVRTGAKGLELLNKAKDKILDWTGKVEEEYQNNQSYTK